MTVIQAMEERISTRSLGFQIDFDADSVKSYLITLNKRFLGLSKEETKYLAYPLEKIRFPSNSVRFCSENL